MKRAIIYTRVSSDEQANNNTSLASQKEDIKRYCDREGIFITEVYVEDYSGKTFDRPEWNKIRAFCQTHAESVDLILVANWYRFGRNVTESFVEISKLSQLNIEVQSIEMNIDFSIPESLLILSTVLAIPEVDNRRRQLVIKRGIKKRLQQGAWPFSCPIGYRRDKNDHQIYITEKGEILKTGFQMISCGKSIVSTCREMKMQGLDISPKKASHVFRNAFYSGWMMSEALDEPILGNHPALVDKQLFDQVQELLNENRSNRINPTDEFFELNQTIKCPKCEGKLTGYFVKKKQKKAGSKEYNFRKNFPGYYKCGSRQKCKMNVSAKKSHQAFDQVLRQITINDAYKQEFENILRAMFAHLTTEYREKITRLKSQKTILENKLNTLTQKFIYHDAIDEDTFRKEKASLNNKIAEIGLALTKAKEKVSNPVDFVSYCITLLANMADLWNESSLEVKEQLGKLIFPQGVYYEKETEVFRTPEMNGIFGFIKDMNEKTTYKSGLIVSCGEDTQVLEPKEKDLIALKSFIDRHRTILNNYQVK